MILSNTASSTCVVAIVATANREELLRSRSLPSIISQSHPCSKIVVVEDTGSEPSCSEVQRICLSQTREIDYLKNRRTQGAAGAWNTGIDHLARCYENPSLVYVAILDDDDRWENFYIEQAIKAIEQGAEIIATPFLRIVGSHTKRTVTPPKSLREADFLVGNPGLQASNLIVRLDKLLEAGCYDESLSSCTDRDLCIRLSRIFGHAYQATTLLAVQHFACPDRNRLCTPGSLARQKGLDVFWNKYQNLMTAEQAQIFTERAENYFNWKRPSFGVENNSFAPELVLRSCDPEESFPLVVGFIADDRRVKDLAPLMDDLLVMQKKEEFSGVDVLILENSNRPTPGVELNKLIQRYRDDGLRVHFIDRRSVRHAVESKELGIDCYHSTQRSAIAHARTILQTYLYQFAKSRTGAVVWIIDDDMRLAPLIDGSKGIKRQWIHLSTLLKQLKEQSVDIAIGCYTGAAPLPASATVRVQLVDLLHNLHWLKSLQDDSVLPNKCEHNRQLRANRRDYYYDLSHNETDRLETPFWLEPAFIGETVAEAKVRLVNVAERILAGEQIFRPLLIGTKQLNEFSLRDELHRGGNTFIFNIDVLKDAPNTAPVLKGRPTRRSDMIWALLQKERFGRNVVTVPIGVFHDRSGLSVPETLDVEGIVDDIQGFAVFNALRDKFQSGDIDLAHRTEKSLEERFSAFRLSFYRIQGLAKELYARTLSESGLDSRERWSEFAQNILKLFHSDRLIEIEKRVHQLTGDHVCIYYKKLDSTLTLYLDGHGLQGCIPRQLLDQRQSNAIAAINGSFGRNHTLRLLGHGSEGTVFTDGKSVYKAIDYWKSHSFSRSKKLLLNCGGRWTDSRHLYPITDVRAKGDTVVLTYPYEDTVPYEGGIGPDIAQLMAECHQARLICRNIHPKNLRVAGNTVRLIDYGSDLQIVNDPNEYEIEFTMMCRRAYLSWRWWFRDDLSALMTASIGDEVFPELEGFGYFMDAVNQVLGKRSASDPVINRAVELKPKLVLDYGCGKGNQAKELSLMGCDVVAYDPDQNLRERLKKLESENLYTTQNRIEALQRKPYDLVICRRVGCLIDDDQLLPLLEDLRTAVGDVGHILFAVCHPAYAPHHITSEATPIRITSNDRERQYIWNKRIHATSRVLTEIHRPEHKLIRMLNRAGLKVSARYERMTIDMERFEPIADILILELVGIEKPDTTLLIKACAMDAKHIDTLIPHLVEQLERPRGFQEVLLTIDSKPDKFNRQFAPADIELLNHKALELQRRGWIDLILHAPESEHDICELSKRWFGIDSPSSHANNGAQLSSMLIAFERCSTRWLLHTDIDIMVARQCHEHDYLGEMHEALSSQSDSVTVSFNIAHNDDRPYTAQETDTPWRTESRIGLLDLERLGKLLPLPNQQNERMLELPWHRSLDLAVLNGCASSLRGGSHQSFFVHPPNDRKRNHNQWFSILAQIERSKIATCQFDQVDLVGGLDEWLIPERFERFIFVICGRNVIPGRFRRCIDSVLRQRHPDWGCIVIDDASSPSIAHEIAEICAPYEDRLTVVMQKNPRGLLANTVEAIRYRCGNPKSVVITLDADDCLIGNDVLDHLATEYDLGADVTVGSMLRTDKQKTYPVDFSSPRENRGANVWQHLRSFRKSLFDAIPDTDLRIDGDYVDLATDWAYMLPIVELSVNPRYITKLLYLHEPGGIRNNDRAQKRESIIAKIVALPSVIERRFENAEV